MEPKAQFHIIIKALKTYIREKLENGKVGFNLLAQRPRFWRQSAFTVMLPSLAIVWDEVSNIAELRRKISL